MEKIRVSVVSYINSLPFMYGLLHSPLLSHITLSVDTPAGCADALLSGHADLGIVPVAVIPLLPERHIVSDYCLGSDNSIRTVVLAGNTELKKIKKIFLDPESRTSNKLVRILCEQYWKIEVEWLQPSVPAMPDMIGDTCASVIIGDKAFAAGKHYSHVYDLAEQWIAFSKLPFVFACWLSVKKLPQPFIANFNKALAEGLRHKKEALSLKDNISNIATEQELEEYLTKNVSYHFDRRKQKSLQMFLEYMHGH